jgi:hypothetical protein
MAPLLTPLLLLHMLLPQQLHSLPLWTLLLLVVS